MNEEKSELESTVLAIRQSLETAKKSIKTAEKWLEQLVGFSDEDLKTISPKSISKSTIESAAEEAIYGIYNGKEMETETGRKFPVPANYASKSKLIEGDSLKMTTLPNGAMIYKQIEIAERELMQGTLILDKDKYKVLCDDRMINVPYASITFFRVKVGDLVTVIVPTDIDKSWGAIESVISVD